MSLTFFITPYPPMSWETAQSTLYIDMEEFHHRLLENWAAAEVQITQKQSLVWRIPEVESVGFFGSIHANHQIASFSPGNWTIMIDFIRWYRIFINIEYKLFLFNSVGWESMELTIATTDADIRSFIFGNS